MNCDLCKKPDPKFLVILPLRQTDGKLDTLVCEDCAKKSKAYYQKHERPHLGFMDGSTACIYCVEELVEANKDNAIEIRDRVRATLPMDQLEELDDTAECAAEISKCSKSVAILRFIASKAMRSHQTVEKVIYQITKSGLHDVSYILR